ncbi:UvrD-helicase domain-containing protein [Thermosediminibacter oceani]|uniref:UvrD/REP helicase n=1 Tax=Thermosediminibacter oceani (strain ATCC BAA-1034 / DSM 16646 / JW/IW-1228P) TaxID=555079 RepID=D9RZP9_THEOJ|nr:UvrD-helicase domain-containing protein [Thermosediminibacter oceani]ADL08676.1 UvrD/REP helicase [Thermosediminibacter oceani DSM 16646]
MSLFNSYERFKEKLRTKKEDELLRKLIPSQTKLYHKVYGEGIFVSLERKYFRGSEEKYINVKFKGEKEIKTFAFPDAIGKHLFMEKTAGIIPEEKIIPDMKAKFFNKQHSSVKPTEEQKRVLEALGGLDRISINAFAGTGKTTTLELIVDRYRDKKLLLMAFNKAIAEELRERLKGFGNVDIYTTHALAYNYVKEELNIGHLKDERELTQFIKEYYDNIDYPLAAFLRKLLIAYCRSSAREINERVVNSLINGDKELWIYHRFALNNVKVSDLAEKLQEIYNAALINDMFVHELYLKYFQINIDRFLRRFKGYYGVLLDEAQDTNPVTFDIFMHIPAKKKVIVGDKHQNIYSWRGTRNYLTHKDFEIFYLTETFRFGEEIAAKANRILRDYKGETNFIKPKKAVARKSNGKTAFITRTNSRIIKLVEEFPSNEEIKFLRQLDDIFLPAVYAREIINYYKYGKFLGYVKLPEYFLALIQNFEKINDFIKYCSTFDKDISMALQIAERYDIDEIKRKAEALCSKNADIVFATAHTTKGLEFDKIVVEDDFPCLQNFIEEYAKIDGKDIGEIMEKIKKDDPNYADLINEINLQYVAVTRAILDVKIKENDTFNKYDKYDLKPRVKSSNKYKTKSRIMSSRMMSLCIRCEKYGNCPGQVESEGTWNRPRYHCPWGYQPKEIVKFGEE